MGKNIFMKEGSEWLKIYESDSTTQEKLELRLGWCPGSNDGELFYPSAIIVIFYVGEESVVSTRAKVYYSHTKHFGRVKIHYVCKS